MFKFFKNLAVFLFIILSVSVLLFFNRYFMKQIYPLKYENIVKEYSREYNLRASLIFAVIKVESDFKKDAVSKAGAMGLMQITQETFNWLKQKEKEESKNIVKSYKNLFDVRTNIKFGVYFLEFLIFKYKDEKVALCAYNAGMGNVDKWLKDKNYSKDGKSLFKVPFKETEEYVEKVIKTEKMYKKLYF